MNRLTLAVSLLSAAASLMGCLLAAPEPGPAAAQTETAPASRPSSGESVDQLLDSMEAARKTLKTFRAEVVKVRQVEVLNDTEKFAGNIQFKTPRLLRPHAQVFANQQDRRGGRLGRRVLA